MTDPLCVKDEERLPAMLAFFLHTAEPCFPGSKGIACLPVIMQMMCPDRKMFRGDDPMTGIERAFAGWSSSGIIINNRRGQLKSYEL